jgi:AraC-like DNA-binding protein
MEIDSIADEKDELDYYPLNSDDLKDLIVKKMEEDQIYLQPNLKITDLAALLGTNRNYLYNAINIGMGISFSEFVNRYRVGHAQRLLIENPTANIVEIATKSGFSSEVTFYRNFKAVTGTTPYKWLKSQK